MTRKAIAIGLGTAVAVALGVDVWLAFDGVNGNTISECFWAWSRETPLVPFLFGLVCGHLVWQR